MAITNFTGDENRRKEYEDFFCSAEISGGTQNQLPVSFEHLVVERCISGKHSDPSRPSQGVVAAPAIQTLVSSISSN